jgi:hypothetical protein
LRWIVLKCASMLFSSILSLAMAIPPRSAWGLLARLYLRPLVAASL